MSGGVDSSVAAALLKEAGYEVVGVFMENWSQTWGSCDVDRDRQDALQVTLKLGIPFRVFNFEKEYQSEVMDYFYAEYQAGRTPNPDVECNRTIKFGLFLKTAVKELGVEKIATGHYARVESLESGIRNLRRGSSQAERGDWRQIQTEWRLFKGVDRNKDQSYFLWTLGQMELEKTLFPLGKMTKAEVRAKALGLDLPVAAKPDSQGICFVGEVNIRKFLKHRLPEKPGQIIDPEGKVLGEHAGAYFYTIGQRRGLNIGGGIPYYVAAIDTWANTVTVAPLNHPALYAKEAVAGRLNWISGRPPKFPFKCQVKIRYRQPDQEAILESQVSSLGSGGNAVLIKFKDDQRAVTPGQSAVFYQGEEVLGGGVIR